MNCLQVTNVEIVDDFMNDEDIIKKITKTQTDEDSFFVLDVGDLIRKHKIWLKEFPRITPHFAVKSNSNSMVIKTLAALNGNFDCASLQEIMQVMECGVTGDRIIFAHPVKFPSHVKYAKKVGIQRMTVDNPNEVHKIKTLFPEAKIVIRIRCDAKKAEINLGNKFGCDPDREAKELINLIKKLGLHLHGFSFHVGSLCREAEAFSRGIKVCNNLIDYAKLIGCKEVCLIDIGGGFPGENDANIREFTEVINEALKDVDSSIKIISEPGRYYVTSAFKLVAQVQGKKRFIHENEERFVYYINEGVFGSFKDEMMGLEARVPTSLRKVDNNELFVSTMWGQTADELDCILKNVRLQKFEIGDWLIWKNMGAYTISLAASSHGFTLSRVYPIIRRTEWEIVCAEERLTNGNVNEKQKIYRLFEKDDKRY
ncbi:antizyme inhibitor 2-like [Leptopilina heterotoma]|uniref:antizyme inhibitor 2-like n=1 Tax=Leptopilina heterotoma TaxID=63436 RepID=UPI001CA8CA0F|nr:antizyme inhibitor 2-like [Leptopilina heterotoma]